MRHTNHGNHTFRIQFLRIKDSIKQMTAASRTFHQRSLQVLDTEDQLRNLLLPDKYAGCTRDAVTVGRSPQIFFLYPKRIESLTSTKRLMAAPMSWKIQSRWLKGLWNLRRVSGRLVTTRLEVKLVSLLELAYSDKILVHS